MNHAKARSEVMDTTPDIPPTIEEGQVRYAVQRENLYRGSTKDICKFDLIVQCTSDLIGMPLKPGQWLNKNNLSFGLSIGLVWSL